MSYSSKNNDKNRKVIYSVRLKRGRYGNEVNKY